MARARGRWGRGGRWLYPLEFLMNRTDWMTPFQSNSKFDSDFSNIVPIGFHFKLWYKQAMDDSKFQCSKLEEMVRAPKGKQYNYQTPSYSQLDWWTSFTSYYIPPLIPNFTPQKTPHELSSFLISPSSFRGWSSSISSTLSSTWQCLCCSPWLVLSSLWWLLLQQGVIKGRQWSP